MNNIVSKCIFLSFDFYLGCLDSNSWSNGKGHGCDSYATTWCQNGGAKPGNEWTLGSKFNYPELNCCVCGKGNRRGNIKLSHVLQIIASF